jgi:hypothetical protein
MTDQESEDMTGIRGNGDSRGRAFSAVVTLLHAQEDATPRSRAATGNAGGSDT